MEDQAATDKAEDISIDKQASNSCCMEWKNKYLKLKDNFTKLEEGRRALRQGISMYEKQINKMQSEIQNLKKVCMDEKVRANSEKEEKMKESTLRASLENEVSALKAEILAFQQTGRTAEIVERDVTQLQDRMSEQEREISQLKELIQKENLRADSEKKKFEAVKKKYEMAVKDLKSEKCRADEEKRLADVERRKSEDYGQRIEGMKREVDEAKRKLALETSKTEEMTKKLEVERQKTLKERKHAEMESAKAEEQRKLVKVHEKLAEDEKNHAAALSKQLKQCMQRVEDLEKDLQKIPSANQSVLFVHTHDRQVMSSNKELTSGCSLEIVREPSSTRVGTNALNFEEAVKRVEHMEQEMIREKMRADLEMKNAEEQRQLVEACKKEAVEEKYRSDCLVQKLELNQQRMKELQNELSKLASSKANANSAFVLSDNLVKAEAAKIKILRKKLKFEKKLVRHAKRVTKLEVARNSILRQELFRLKQDFIQSTQRLEMLDCSLFQNPEAAHDIFKMPLHFGGELVTPNHTSGLHQNCPESFKQNIDYSGPLPSVSGILGSKSRTGIDSKLMPPIRGSKRNLLLESSAINSSSASFSDRSLVGSQEKGAILSTSTKIDDGKSDVPATMLRLPDNTKVCNEHLVAVGENSVRSPAHGRDNGRRDRHRKKRKTPPDIAGSINNLYLEGQKWHQQLADKLSVLDNAILGLMREPLEKIISSKVTLRGKMCNMHVGSCKKRKEPPSEDLQQVSNYRSEPKRRIEPLTMEGSDLSTEVSPPTHDVAGNGRHQKSGSDDTEHFLQVVDGDYLKLLRLDNDIDEKSYCVAIENPLSPGLPEIDNLELEVIGSENNRILQSEDSSRNLSNANGPVHAAASFDVADLKIDSFDNSLKLRAENAWVQTLRSDDGCLSYTGAKTCQFQDAAVFSKRELSISRSQGSKILMDCGNHLLRSAKLCVCYSDNNDISSISRIFCSINSSIANCSAVSSSVSFMSDVLLSLSGSGELTSKERVSAFFSLLLHEDAAVRDFENGFDSEFVGFIDTFSLKVSSVLHSADLARSFREFCDLYELLALIEDFLLNRRLLVNDCRYSETAIACQTKVSVPMEGCFICLSAIEASTQLLIMGAVVLASICAVTGHVGFICEVSFNIFRMLKSDLSLVLKLLHVFAHLCGSKYLTHDEHDLEMTVVKSLVTSVEKLISAADSPSRTGILAVDSSITWSCSACPFPKFTPSISSVVFLLLDKLQCCASPVGMKHDCRNSEPLSTPGIDYHQEKTIEKSGCEKSVVSNSVFLVNSLNYANILSLLELVASFTNWLWIFENVVSPLLEMMETCVTECFSTAVVALIGQLGRLGVDASCYEDSSIEILRAKLCAFLNESASRRFGLPTQITLVTTILGLTPHKFEEFIQRNTEPPAFGNPSNPAADCIREWFFLMSDDQKSSVRPFLSSGSCVLRV